VVDRKSRATDYVEYAEAEARIAREYIAKALKCRSVEHLATATRYAGVACVLEYLPDID